MAWDVTGKYSKVDVVKADGTTIPDKEPVFVLRAQDILAPIVLQYYAEIYQAATGDFHHASEIRSFAQVMTTWTPRKLPD